MEVGAGEDVIQIRLKEIFYGKNQACEMKTRLPIAYMPQAPRKGRSNVIFRCHHKGLTAVLGREGRKRKVNL